MPEKKPKFKGDPDTTYVVNHPEKGEIKFSTDEKGEYSPKTEIEREAIDRVYGLKEG
jgi:hypothetical protein